MIKKIITIFLILLLSACCVGAGFWILGTSSTADETVAPIPPGITKPEGRIVSANPKIVEGRITKLTDKKMCISVQGVEWELVLDDTGRKTVQRLNEVGVEIVKGTFVTIHYKEENGKRIATKIMRLEAN